MKPGSEERSVRIWYVSTRACASDVHFFKTLKMNARFDAE